MKYAEFKKQLSARLTMEESEVEPLLRANRKILKKLVNKDNGFSIPNLGLFKKHPISKQKEYSHYHGYELLTKLKKILIFYPESLSGTKVSEKAITHSDISDLLTNSTGVSSMLSQQFLCETASVIKDGLARDNQVYVSGVGLFKINQSEKNDTLKKLEEDDKCIQFKADAGLRNNILKSNDRAIRQYSRGSFEAVNSLMALRMKTNETAKIRQPFAVAQNSGTDLYDGVSENHEERLSKILKCNPVNEQKLTRETFLQENKDLYIQDKHPYFEWAVIAIFLIILASGIYLIKPSIESSNEFSSAPFEFNDIPEPVTSAASIPDQKD